MGAHATRVLTQRVANPLAIAFASLVGLMATTATAQGPPRSPDQTLLNLSPEVLFQRASPSVFVVEGVGVDGKALAQGSGVVVAPDGIVTNRHVLEKAIRMRVKRGTQIWEATVRYLDPEHDLVQLRVPGLNAPPAPIRNSATLVVGERVYAIGAPKGLELSMSEGLISGLRPYDGVQIIQTTAAMSPGSSGGGLFDAQGHLVGITTFQFKEGQSINFALPGEWVKALPSHPFELPKGRGGLLPFDDPLAWYNLGTQAFEARDWTRAISALREAIRLNPRIVQAWNNLGAAYLGLGEHAQAQMAWREALRLNPDHVTSWYNLGYLYLTQGQHASAIPFLREALRLRPDYAEAWASLGYAYRRQGQFADATKASQEAVRLKPDLGGAWRDLGYAQAGLSQYQQAATAFREACKLNPEDHDAWIGLGLVYVQLGQHAQAITALSEAIRQKPDSTEAWYSLGAAYAAQGDRSRVIEVYKQLKSLKAAKAEEFFRTFVSP